MGPELIAAIAATVGKLTLDLVRDEMAKGKSLDDLLSEAGRTAILDRVTIAAQAEIKAAEDRFKEAPDEDA
jgi:hypothetical protein